jgi:cyclopropane fatty-acyl-phospholipid synthase-like methyltransferase
MRSNLAYWQTLQNEDYFESHPFYKGLPPAGTGETRKIVEEFTRLKKNMQVVVIGCGYGRETTDLAPRVRHVYGIDVNKKILKKAQNYLRRHRITNFTPILAESYHNNIPNGVDFVFSVAVMQHLSRDLVVDYFRTLGEKLSSDGAFLIQFFEGKPGTYLEHDAELKVYEPSVTWTVWDLVELSNRSGLRLDCVKTTLVNATSLWHWALFTKGLRTGDATFSSKTREFLSNLRNRLRP